ncbi:hypothetical protein ZWY2020_041968 [Hordeum vulgare]|nr:hypothetical protein ZWY2020_041968 [Hordeum vulgare]
MAVAIAAGGMGSRSKGTPEVCPRRGPPGGYLHATTTTTKIRKHEHLPDLLKLDRGLPGSRLDQMLAFIL